MNVKLIVIRLLSIVSKIKANILIDRVHSVTVGLIDGEHKGRKTVGVFLLKWLRGGFRSECSGSA